MTLNQCKLHVQRKVAEEVGGDEKEGEDRASEREGDRRVVEGTAEGGGGNLQTGRERRTDKAGGGVCGREGLCLNESSWSHDTFCVCHMRRGSKRTRQLKLRAGSRTTQHVLRVGRDSRERSGGEHESRYVV